MDKAHSPSQLQGQISLSLDYRDDRFIPAGAGNTATDLGSSGLSVTRIFKKKQVFERSAVMEVG
jgi:hypothetical protein